MKKIISLVIMMALSFSVFSACGDKNTPAQKSEDELRAEIRAELEAEMEKNKDNEEDQEVKTKTFDEVNDSQGLVGTINYFEKNYSMFNIDDKKEFLSKIISSLSQNSRKYIESLEKIEVDEPMAPRVIQYEDSLYKSIYDAKTNTLYLDSLDTDIKDTVENILADDIFILTMSYYIGFDKIKVSGFTAVVPQSIYSKIEKWADEIDKELLSYAYILYPNDYLEANADTWVSTAPKYSCVLLESKVNIELLLAENKVEAYLEVNINENKKPIEELDTEGNTSISTINIKDLKAGSTIKGVKVKEVEDTEEYISVNLDGEYTLNAKLSYTNFEDFFVLSADNSPLKTIFEVETYPGTIEEIEGLSYFSIPMYHEEIKALIGETAYNNLLQDEELSIDVSAILSEIQFYCIYDRYSGSSAKIVKIEGEGINP